MVFYLPVAGSARRSKTSRAAYAQSQITQAATGASRNTKGHSDVASRRRLAACLCDSFRAIKVAVAIEIDPGIQFPSTARFRGHTGIAWLPGRHRGDGHEAVFIGHIDAVVGECK